jgi:hypothetical protein
LAKHAGFLALLSNVERVGHPWFHRQESVNPVIQSVVDVRQAAFLAT